jgi:TRAP-type C4-dicarboxylate transport system substrate-binding protein
MNAPHKQSGDIDNPNNFNNHKEQSLDKVNGRKIQVYNNHQTRELYKPYYDFIEQNQDQFPKELIEKFEWKF